MTGIIHLQQGPSEYMQPPPGADVALLRGDALLSAVLEDNSSAWQYKPCLPLHGLITALFTGCAAYPHSAQTSLVVNMNAHKTDTTLWGQYLWVIS